MRSPFLLTPGPLTTSDTVKQAMLRDWGSRDETFIVMNRDMRDRLVALANGQQTHVCVPLQGSGTFAIEATIATLLPRDGKLLVLVNGAYGKRMVQITRTMGRSVEALEWREDQLVDPQALDQRLSDDKDITHVAVVHCETTSGILNPIEAVAEVVAAHGRALIIDAMSAFGALPLDARRTRFAAAVASSNKCLEGVPGMGFALIRSDVLEHCKGNAHSLSLDLFDQWEGFEKNGQWRFTPPTQVIARVPPGSRRARRGGRGGRAGQTLRPESRDPGGRHGSLGIPLPAGESGPGAHHRDFPHAGRPAFHFRGVLQAPKCQGVLDLPWQTDRCRFVPYRLHRSSRRSRDARSPGRDWFRPRRNGRARRCSRPDGFITARTRLERPEVRPCHQITFIVTLDH